MSWYFFLGKLIYCVVSRSLCSLRRVVFTPHLSRLKIFFSPRLYKPLSYRLYRPSELLVPWQFRRILHFRVRGGHFWQFNSLFIHSETLLVSTSVRSSVASMREIVARIFSKWTSLTLCLVWASFLYVDVLCKPWAMWDMELLCLQAKNTCAGSISHPE